MGEGAGASAHRSIFVGRQAELSMLVAGVDEAIEGQGRGFLVTGEAGIGKTRLASELAAHARSLPVSIAWGRCWESGGAPAYWPWLEVLRSLEAGGGSGSGSAADARRALEQPAEIQSARFEVFGRVADRLRRLSERRPVLVVIDDLHAADLPSVLLLEFLLGGIVHRARLVIVALTRDRHLSSDEEHRAAMLRIRRLTSAIPLSGLRRSEIATLIDATIGGPTQSDVVELVHDATAGNPFFAEEMAALVRHHGGHVDLPPVPTGVRQTLHQRLAPLGQDTVGLLAAASVLGREFDLDVAAHLADVSAFDATAAVGPAVVDGLVSGTGSGGYRFRHILLRDVLYDGLDALQRAELHAIAGRTLELRGGGDPGLHLAQLAHHFVAAIPAGEAARALHYVMLAASHAEERLAYERAAHHFDEARRIVQGGAAGDAADLCDALIGLGRAYERSGSMAPAMDALAEAARIARATADGERLARAALALTERVRFQQREDASTVRLLEEALDALPREASAARVRLLGALARILSYAGDRARSLPLAEQAVAEARRCRDQEVLAEVLAARDLLLWEPDRLSERVTNATEMLSLAEATGARVACLDAHMSMLISGLEAGDVRAVDRSLAAYDRLAEELGQPRFRFMAMTRRAMRLLMRGDFRKGLALARAARALGADSGEPDTEPVYHALLAFLVGGVELDADVEGFFLEFSTRHTSVGSRALLAMFSVRRHDPATARSDLDSLLRDIASLPKDMDWLLCVAMAGETAHFLDDAAAAETLYPLLLPYEDRCVVVAGAVAFGGSVAYYLGVLAATLGHFDDAERHLQLSAQQHVALAARPWLIRSLCAHAEVLGARETTGDPARVEELLASAHSMADDIGWRWPGLHPQRASVTGTVAHDAQEITFRRGEGGWLVGPLGKESLLPDAKGLGFLAQLLRRPGQEVHALDLASGFARPMFHGDAGALLDDRAKAAYRRRLEELREDIDEAEAWADDERAVRAKVELDALTAELAASVGIHGRDRRAADVADRARVSVRKALVRSIEAVTRTHPHLGRYLATTVRTGTYCVYEPDPRFGITWNVTI